MYRQYDKKPPRRVLVDALRGYNSDRADPRQQKFMVAMIIQMRRPFHIHSQANNSGVVKSGPFHSYPNPQLKAINGNGRRKAIDLIPLLTSYYVNLVAIVDVGQMATHCLLSFS